MGTICGEGTAVNSTSSILVEWLSHGSGKGSLSKLVEGMNAVGILKEEMEPNAYKSAQYAALRELSDCSILDFGDYGSWTVQSTRVALIKQDASTGRAVLCGARDSRVHLLLSKLSGDLRSEPLGQFGVQFVGRIEAIESWSVECGIPSESHWVALQLQSSLEQLGAPNAKRASEPREALPALSVKEGPIELRRLECDFRRETTQVLPSPTPGVVLEVVEQLTSRRIRYVGTTNGWLRVPHTWAPWVCAAGQDRHLAEIRTDNSLSVPLWARLPEGISRAVTLASGTPWLESGGRLVSGSLPDALLFNIKRILSLG